MHVSVHYCLSLSTCLSRPQILKPTWSTIQDPQIPQCLAKPPEINYSVKKSRNTLTTSFHSNPLVDPFIAFPLPPRGTAPGRIIRLLHSLFHIHFTPPPSNCNDIILFIKYTHTPIHRVIIQCQDLNVKYLSLGLGGLSLQNRLVTVMLL